MHALAIPADHELCIRHVAQAELCLEEELGRMGNAAEDASAKLGVAIAFRIEPVERDATAEAMAAALLPLLSDTPERRRQVEAFACLDRIMDIGDTAPSDHAAALVLQVSGGI